MFSDRHYDDLSWNEVDDFHVVYEKTNELLHKHIKQWQEQGRCMLFDKDETSSRYLVRSKSGFYNFLKITPDGSGWALSNGIRAYRLGYYIVDPLLTPTDSDS